MALAQLIYTSRRSRELTPDVLDRIIGQSEVKNASRAITGVLLCCGSHLMQLLEGELTDVITLFECIRSDARHTDIRCLLCKNVSKRMFPEWGMGLADLESRAILNQDRLMALVEQVRSSHDTAQHSVEARMLLQDFKRQLQRAHAA